MKKCIAIIAMVLTVTALSGCVVPRENNRSSTPKSNSTTDSNSNNSSSSNEQSDSTSSTVETYKMGDTITTETWEITVNSVDVVDKIESGYIVFKPDEGNKYVAVSITAKNTNTEADTFLPSYGTSKDVRAKIKYQEYEFSAINLLGYDEDMHDTYLNPLSSKTGTIIFSIASEIADKTDELYLVLSENKKEYDFILQ